MSAKTDHVARMLLAEHHQGMPYHPLKGEEHPANLTEAYEVQDALCGLLCKDGRDSIAGYKVALTSKAMQEMVKVDQPLSGAVLASRVRAAPVTLKPNEFQRLGIECELAVRLGKTLTSGGSLYDKDSVRGAIAEIMPAFELIDDRRADYAQIDPESLVADNAWNAGVVLGAAIADWEDFDFVASRGTLKINGKPHAEGKAGDALDHPLNAVAWLANALHRRGSQLDAGMIVMTGSIVRTVFPEPGDELVYSLDGCGEAMLSLSKS